MARRRSLLAVLALSVGVIVTTGHGATAVYVPRTLSLTVPVVAGAVVDPAFPADFVAVRWDGAHGAAGVRLRHGGTWSAWQQMYEDGVEVEGAYLSAPFAAGDADALQVRVPPGVHGARVTAINTTDGELVRVGTARGAAHAATSVISRAQWGADESLRDGAAPVYYPLQKLTVHHTVTANNDPNPAATVRAIYSWHLQEGFGDIGYHFLIGPAGQVYEGRWSGTDGHVGGNNSGNLGVSLLGDFTATSPTAAARSSLESILTDLVTRHRIAPQATSTYVNPADSTITKTLPNISGHRDWSATACPGDAFYPQLPSVRLAVDQRHTPVVSLVRSASITRRAATIRWSSDEPATSRVEYWTLGAPQHSPTSLSLKTAHAIRLGNLRGGTRYYYRVVSRDAAGNAGRSATYSFLTPR